jgi:hypothetical protein
VTIDEHGKRGGDIKKKLVNKNAIRQEYKGP